MAPPHSRLPSIWGNPHPRLSPIRISPSIRLSLSIRVSPPFGVLPPIWGSPLGPAAQRSLASQNPQYELKDGTSGPLPSGMAQPAAYYPYEPALGQYPYDR